MSSMPSIRYAIWFLTIAAAFTILKVAAPLFGPIVLALVLGVVLSPFAGRIDRLGAPPALSAFLTMLSSLCVLLFLLFMIQPVLTDLVRRAPLIWDELRETLITVQSTMSGLDNMSEQISEALNDGGENNAGEIVASADNSNGDGEEESVDMPSVADAIFYAPSFAGRLLIFIGTLYFFLLSRKDVYDWITASTMDAGTAEMLEAEHEVSKYFLTITIINAGLGTLVAAALWLVGLPYAVLWGFVAFLINFILYLGPAMFALSLMLAGIVAFDGIYSFLPAAIYVGLNGLEAQFVTPTLVGRMMKVNPLMVFLSLVFWLWMWGPVGGVIAIPLLVWGLALYKRSARFRFQTISSGTPGKLRPNLLAGDKR